MSLSREKEKLLQRLKNSRFRRKEGLFLVEGIRSAGEFLGAGESMGAGEFLGPRESLGTGESPGTGPTSGLRFALVSPRLESLQGGEHILKLLKESGIPFTSLEDADLVRLSETESPQGILLVVEEPGGPPADEQALAGISRPRVLLLDGIQDPGNVGTLIRGARAFGLDGVVALEGTADPWGAKAVRASAGALAHIPVFRMSVQEALAWIEARGVPILVAETGGRDLRTVRTTGGWALVVGNEGAGSRHELRKAAREILSIPMAPGVDSLNVAVAGSILLFTLGTSGPGGGSHEAESGVVPVTNGLEAASAEPGEPGFRGGPSNESLSEGERKG